MFRCCYPKKIKELDEWTPDVIIDTNDVETKETELTELASHIVGGIITKVLEDPNNVKFISYSEYPPNQKLFFTHDPKLFYKKT